MHEGRYVDRQATPEGISFDIASGERSNFHQYCAAINAARRSIYIENQYVDVPEIVDCLRGALKRGVDVVLLMPAEPEVRLQTTPERCAFLKARTELGTYQNFMLAGIAGTGADGHRRSIYVHAKLMLVDDEWATVGSCNLHRFSLFGNGETNAAFSEPNIVRAFRCELLREHLDQDTLSLDDRNALDLFRKIARANRRKCEAGDHAWQGLACHNLQQRRIRPPLFECWRAEQLLEFSQQGGLADAGGTRKNDDGVGSGFGDGLQKTVPGVDQQGMRDREVPEVLEAYGWRFCQKRGAGRRHGAHQKRSNTGPSVRIGSEGSGEPASLAEYETGYWPSSG
jgi:hypothetical protein